MKYPITIIFTILLFACNKQENAILTIPFEYDNEAKAQGFNIFYVPIQIEGIQKPFRMQFDLGLDVSVIYEKPLNSIIKANPGMGNKLLARKDYSILKTPYSIGAIKSSLDSLFLYEGYGDDTAAEALDVIGSIGVNEFQKNILLINYPEQYIKVLQNNTQLNEQDFEFTEMSVTANKKIIIKIMVNGREYDMLFDTGNGVPLLTLNNDFYDRITKNQSDLRDTISGNSWGNTIYLYGAQLQYPLGVKRVNLSTADKRLYYTETARIKALYSALNVEHSIGNDFFMDKTIVFDFVYGRFGVSKK